MPIASDAAVPRRLTNRSPRRSRSVGRRRPRRYRSTDERIVCVRISGGQVPTIPTQTSIGRPARGGRDGITMPTTADEMVEVVGVFDAVWGSAPPVVTVELLTAVAHAGGYVSLARDPRTPRGASGRCLPRHPRPPRRRARAAQPRHRPRRRRPGHRCRPGPEAPPSDWAAANGLDWIVWTFDPLVRRNAWFNLAVLGARVCEYLPSFYGTMSDAINAGDESDRLLVAWDVHGRPAGTRRGPGLPIDGLLVPTPEDIVELRRTDPVAVARWRTDTGERSRQRSTTGGRSSDSPRREYVIGSPA